jgi:hypothetical protein
MSATLPSPNRGRRLAGEQDACAHPVTRCSVTDWRRDDVGNTVGPHIPVALTLYLARGAFRYAVLSYPKLLTGYDVARARCRAARSRRLSVDGRAHMTAGAASSGVRRASSQGRAREDPFAGVRQRLQSIAKLAKRRGDGPTIGPSRIAPRPLDLLVRSARHDSFPCSLAPYCLPAILLR